MTTPELLPTDDEYFGVKCKKCGWVGSSFESKGGESNADAGDYSDITCPHCFVDGFYGEVLEDATENELCYEIVRLRRAPTPDTRLQEAAEEAEKYLTYLGEKHLFEDAGYSVIAKLRAALATPKLLPTEIVCPYCNGTKSRKLSLREGFEAEYPCVLCDNGRFKDRRAPTPDTRLREAAKELKKWKNYSENQPQRKAAIVEICAALDAIEGKATP